MLNQSVAKTTAENRALAELAPLLEMNGIRYRLSRSSLGEHLQLEQDDPDIRVEETEMRPIPDGWLAIVYAKRPPELEAKMASMLTMNVRANATAPKLPEAMRVAKDKAIKELIAKATTTSTGSVTVRGTITMAALNYTLPEELIDPVTVSVSLRGHVDVDTTRELSEPDALSIAESVLGQQIRDGMWSEALSSVEMFLAEYPQNLKLGVLKAGIHMELDEMDSARADLRRALKKREWNETQDTLTALEPYVGVEGADELETLAIDAGILSPPTVGVVADPTPKAASRPEPKKKKRRKRRRKKR
ncbi:MAG: hypothetical protein AAFV36_08065 [Myxococcota bacterium]